MTIDKLTPSEIYQFIKACEEDNEINLINFTMIQDKIIAEFCKEPYKKNARQLLFSMTKSFSALAIGIAIDKGLITLDDYVVDFFKDKIKEDPHPNLPKIQLRHLLTMTSGIHENTYLELFVQPDWIRAFLAQEFPHEPGTYYKYSTHTSHMLSAIIQEVSGVSLEVFLTNTMFIPLGITDVQWEYSPEGLTAGGMGLSLCPSALVKVAQMLINKGMYHNKRIISEEYLALATSLQVVKQDDVVNQDKYYSGYQYGFQFHVSPNNIYRADGAFGQFIIISPENNWGIVATSQNTKVERFLTLINKYFIQQTELKDRISQEQLEAYLTRLSYVTLNQCSNTAHIPQYYYCLEKNELNIQQINLMNNQLNLIYSNEQQDGIKFDFQKKVYGKSYFLKDLQVHLQEHCVVARWDRENRLSIMVYYIETPYVVEYNIDFREDRVIFTFSINVSMVLKGFSVIGMLHYDCV